jgi:hypothetical protein
MGKARCPQSLCEMVQLVNGGPLIMNAGFLAGTPGLMLGAQDEGPAIQLGQECPQRQTELSKTKTENMISPCPSMLPAHSL